MTNPEEREKRSRRLKRRNLVAKSLRDQGERRGAFALRVINGKRKDRRLRRHEIERMVEDE